MENAGRSTSRKRGREEEEPSKLNAAGKIVKLELENFMCHAHLKLKFNVRERNCFYIIGENGTGKSAIFAALSMGLGANASKIGRGDRVQSSIKEGQSRACIRVTLLNVGPGAYPNYGEHITVERTISQHCSNYRILDAQGAEKSRKKADLDKITAHFKIKLDDPLSWLSQDRARYFLQEMKPEKLYEMYQAASQIGRIDDIYEDIGRTLVDRDEQFRKASEKREACKERVNNIKALIEDESKLPAMGKRNEHFHWMLLFANPRETEKIIREQENKLQRADENLTKCREQVAQHEADQQKIDESVGAETAAIEELKGRLRALQPEIDAIRDERRALSTVEEQLKHDRGEVVKRKTVLEDDMRKTNEQIQKYCAGGNFEQEIKNIDAEIARLSAESEELQERINSQKRRADDLVHQQEQDRYNADQRCKSLDSRIKYMETEKARMVAAQKNRLALFGTDAPRIVKLIEDNAHLFKKKPLGPIGNYITLREGKWASPVEYILTKLGLGKFICSSAEDRRRLEQLCRDNGIRNPSIVTYSFSSVKYRVSGPHESFATVLRVIDVEEPTVFNLLVDMASIDNIILMEGEDDTRHLMHNPPPNLNARRAITLECSEVYAPDERMPYRFYSNRRTEPRVFAQKATFDERNINFDLERLHTEARTATQEREQAERALRAAKQEAEKLMATISTQAAQLRRNASTITERKKRRGDLEKLATHEGVIEDLRANLAADERTLQQCLADIQGYKRSIEELSAQRAVLDQRSNRSNSAKAEHRKDIQTHEAKKDSLKSDRAKAQEEVEKHRGRISRLEEAKKRVEDAIVALKDELEKLCAKRDREKSDYEIPPDFSDPPQEDKLLSPALISDGMHKNELEIQKLRQRIEDAKVEYGANLDVQGLREMLEQARRQLNECDEEVKHWRPVFEMQTDAQNMEVESHAGRKLALPGMLQKAFSELMQMRGYIGEIEFDHDGKKILIHVETHGDRPTEKTQAKREISQLSGGERSFSTSCFVMALWECVVESPFRLMDEFDIFMDQQARRLTMEGLSEAARNQPKHQFIFFTPQGLGGIRDMDNIQVFDLGKKQAEDDGRAQGA